MSDTDPIARFSEWLEEARAERSIPEPTAMTLATATKDGAPSARIVLLKAHDGNGFVFYTNLESRKGEELAANPRAALCFYWAPLLRQVRIEGGVTPVSDAEADAYFTTRDRNKQAGAWASKQSRPLASRPQLVTGVSKVEADYDEKSIPRPPFWSGWRLKPEHIEFWQEGEFRLHQRDLYTRDGSGWKHTLLYP